jgi:hypothetical protein
MNQNKLFNEVIPRVKDKSVSLKIWYPSGYMELYLDYFFPCSIDVARRVFPLLQMYASELEKEKLVQYLKDQDHYYLTQMIDYYGKLDGSTNESREFYEYQVKYDGLKQMREMINTNLVMFLDGRDVK